MGLPSPQGLYDPRNEHDACGVGFVADIKGRKSHDIVRMGLEILVNLDHRGAVGADPLVGDGAGVLIQIPDALLREWAKQEDVDLPPPGEYGVAMCFLPRDPLTREVATSQFERFIRVEGQILVGWRDVPVNTDGMGHTVLSEMPVIRQCIIGRGPQVKDQDAFERKLLTIRKQTQNPLSALAERRSLPGLTQFYIPSMSTRTVVYKGLLLATRVGAFYEDLRNPLTQSALALCHQRFSTNTFPSWKLSHPYRFIAHNGEINTVRGNRNWMNARRRTMESDLLGPDLDKMWPLVQSTDSDTASLDNALELLVAGGYPLAHAVMMLIPEAWSGNPMMDPKRRAFYEYHAALMEPWDGPAAIAFTDGRQIGATLDRNGLRPARFIVTDDDLVVMASEVGVLPIPDEKIVRKWRLQPGKMLLIDLEEGRIVEDEEIKATLAAAEPYEEWLAATQFKLEDLPDAPPTPAEDVGPLLDRQQAFGYTQEDLKFFLEPMAQVADDPLGSMGHDTPIAVLSKKPKMLYEYFKQNFAQVTNPPIDPSREELVDEPSVDDRPAAQPAWPRRRGAQASGSLAAGADQRRPGKDSGDLRAAGRGVPHGHSGRHVAGHRGGRRPGAGGAGAVRAGHRVRASRQQHPDHLRPGDRAGPHPDTGGPGHGGGAPSPDPPGPAHADRPGHRDRAKRAKCTISVCWPAMAPRR